jgi:hypothetical protein
LEKRQRRDEILKTPLLTPISNRKQEITHIKDSDQSQPKSVLLNLNTGVSKIPVVPKKPSEVPQPPKSSENHEPKSTDRTIAEPTKEEQIEIQLHPDSDYQEKIFNFSDENEVEELLNMLLNKSQQIIKIRVEFA